MSCSILKEPSRCLNFLHTILYTTRYRGRPVTKEEFQAWFYGIHPYGGPIEEYNPQTVPAYFPDLTNPQFQELLLSWAEKHIDCGAEAIWIDMLYRQATLLAQMTGDLRHPAVRESLAAASQIVERIREYGVAEGRRVYVGSWVGPFVLAELEGQAFPYEPPEMDFVTLSPTIEEVLAKRLDEERWAQAVTLVREKYGEIPLIAFIDWSFDESPLVAFSQQLTPEEQREALQEFDRVFRELGILFAYPVHGGYMGRGEVTTRLAFGRYRIYDALAPEFDTYGTIVELARARAGEACLKSSLGSPAGCSAISRTPRIFERPGPGEEGPFMWLGESPPSPGPSGQVELSPLPSSPRRTSRRGPR